MSQADYDMLSLPVIVAWLRKNWGKMVLGGVACAFIAFPVALLKAQTYESTSTLLVAPPAFKSIGKPTLGQDMNDRSGSFAEMMSSSLPVEAYKALALSPSLLDQVIREIPLEGAGVIALQRQLYVELVQMGGRSPQGVAYTQALVFHAEADTPELAAKTATTWAAVFKRQMDELSAKGIKEGFTLLSSLHERTRSELDTAEQALVDHAKTWNLELINAQLEAKANQLTEFEGNLKQTEIDLASSEARVKALKSQLADEPKKLQFFRAPSDDAYWIAGLDRSENVPEKGLLTEEPNPNYITTRADIVAGLEEIEGLKAKKDALAGKREELNTEIKSLTAALADKQLERDRLTRDITSLQSSYSMVRQEFEKGRMAKSIQASEIIITGAAVVPDAPNSMPSTTLVIAAFILGTCATGALLVGKDISEVTGYTVPE